MTATYTAHAKGQLRHYFHGKYFAGIALVFAEAYAAEQALLKLGAGWHISEYQATALIWHGDSDALNACKTVLVSFGADERKIDSLAKSVDYGEPFAIAVPIPVQGQGELAL
jgi:hypothetical protein